MAKETNVNEGLANLSESIHDCLVSPNETDRNGEPANMTDALFEIGRVIMRVGQEIGKEGATGMGAIEGLGVCVKEAGEQIASAISDLAEAIREVRLQS